MTNESENSYSKNNKTLQHQKVIWLPYPASVNTWRWLRPSWNIVIRPLKHLANIYLLLALSCLILLTIAWRWSLINIILKTTDIHRKAATPIAIFHLLRLNVFDYKHANVHLSLLLHINIYAHDVRCSTSLFLYADACLLHLVLRGRAIPEIQLREYFDENQLSTNILVFLYHNFSVVGLSSCVFIPALFLCFLQAHPYL